MPVDHYENFPVASLLLPRRLREPIEAIYHFARYADDIADEGESTPSERLALLNACSDALRGIEANDVPERPLFQRLAATINAWKLPIGLFHDLISAFSQDVTQTRYQDRAQLLSYCVRSANPIGRLLLHLVDRVSAQNLYYSDCVCTALQLINFWQDIAIDWAKGRVYLPKASLAAHGLDFSVIEKRQVNAAWQAMLQDEIAYARELMLKGEPLVRVLPGRMGFEIRLTIQGGYRILEKIEAARGDVFFHRPILQKRDWLTMFVRACSM